MKKPLALVSLALWIAACGILSPWKATAPAPKIPAKPAPVPKAAPSPAPAPPPGPAPEPASPSPEAVAAEAYAAGSGALGEGRPDRALDLFAEAWKEHPGHPGVREQFPVALERLKKEGDDAERKGNPEEAGKAWAAVLANLSHPAAKGKELSFNRTRLRENLDRLTKTLMDKGLVEYREGRFESAISWWKKILAYDPGNEEAAKSVRTATTQLENLKKINPPK